MKLKYKSNPLGLQQRNEDVDRASNVSWFLSLFSVYQDNALDSYEMACLMACSTVAVQMGDQFNLESFEEPEDDAAVWINQMAQELDQVVRDNRKRLHYAQVGGFISVDGGRHWRWFLDKREPHDKRQSPRVRSDRSYSILTRGAQMNNAHQVV